MSGSSVVSRVLIFVVAYEAEGTLAAVLDRIPSDIPGVDLEVLVIDDKSNDRTFEVGLRTRADSRHKITVLYNTINQGYGGNQKLGYAFAIRHGFDFVVLLHGDGQYAPEFIPKLLEPLQSGSADAVFGSRMMVAGAARRGGMPLYKYVGNRILTTIQNRMLGSNLSEFHSGFRAYRVSALAKLPFESNSNVFHFDTEIIIQFLMGGYRITEVPIPTYYGDEICRVNGMRYAKDVMKATVASRFHLMNILYDRKFDLEGIGNQHYDLKLDFKSTHSAVLSSIAPHSRVLDIGCGPGAFARALASKGCVVDGADQFYPADVSSFRRFIQWKEPDRLRVSIDEYDDVLLLDIIEHLKDPEGLLDGLRAALTSPERLPRIIVTTGNVAFAPVRFQLMAGNFNYGKRGILDLTHTRLFTFRSLRYLFEQSGFTIERVEGVPAPFPLALGDNAFSRWLVTLNAFLIRILPGLFSYQILMVVRPRPTVDALLDDSIASSHQRAASLNQRVS